MTSLRLRALIAAAATAALALTTVTPATAAPAADPVLRVESIAFDRAAVDVTSDYATVNLTWTITNRAARAQSVNGVVELRQFAGDEQIGQPYTTTYDLSRGSGTAQRSTFVHEFAVPRFAPVAETVWRVTKVTIADDVAHARTVRDPGPATLAVTQLVDSAGPVAEQLYFDFNQPRAFYDDGSGVTLRYRVQIVDETAFKKGKLTLAGPGGKRLSATFQLTRSGSSWSCEGETAWDPTWVTCPVAVAVPAGSPSGSWRVARLDLTDSWGNARADTSPEGPEPVLVTATISSARRASRSPRPRSTTGGARRRPTSRSPRTARSAGSPRSRSRSPGARSRPGSRRCATTVRSRCRSCCIRAGSTPARSTGSG
jgi:hypothetical protein